MLRSVEQTEGEVLAAMHDGIAHVGRENTCAREGKDKGRADRGSQVTDRGTPAAEGDRGENCEGTGKDREKPAAGFDSARDDRFEHPPPSVDGPDYFAEPTGNRRASARRPGAAGRRSFP